MAETNPQTGVAPTPANVDPMARLGAFIDREEGTQPDAPAEEQQPAPPGNAAPQESQAPEAALTPEDIPDAEAPPEQPAAAEAFEIVHNGQQHTLTREEVVSLAQQGFDYTQKTQALAEQARSVADRLARVQAMEQVAPQLEQAKSIILAMDSQLGQYAQVDWVRLASTDPLEYSKIRAQYDVLVGTRNQAMQQYGYLAQQINEQQRAVRGQVLAQEEQALPQRIPEWKDPAKREAGKTELAQWLIRQGATPEEVNGLTSSLAVQVAWQAMQYDKLLRAKGEKVKQLRAAPPVARPGANPRRDEIAADKDRELRSRLKKSGDTKDLAAILMNRMK